MSAHVHQISTLMVAFFLCVYTIFFLENTCQILDKQLPFLARSTQKKVMLLFNLPYIFYIVTLHVGQALLKCALF
jgi:hypothetical protein